MLTPHLSNAAAKAAADKAAAEKAAKADAEPVTSSLTSACTR
jgi:hypothetical protein